MVSPRRSRTLSVRPDFLDFLRAQLLLARGGKEEDSSWRGWLWGKDNLVSEYLTGWHGGVAVCQLSSSLGAHLQTERLPRGPHLTWWDGFKPIGKPVQRDG